jgi:hypothetical protein
MSNIDVQLFSVQQLRTRMAEDLIPDAVYHAWLPQMGMVPGSVEGAAMEKAAGDLRRAEMHKIMPSIQLFTGLATDLMQKAILLHGGHSTEEDIPIPLSSLPLSSLAVTMAVFVQLLDLGIIKINSSVVEGMAE